MHQPDKPAVMFGDDRMHRLIHVEEARPCHARNGGIQRGGPRPPVERVVTVPKRQPLVVIAMCNRTDDRIGGHGGAFLRSLHGILAAVAAMLSLRLVPSGKFTDERRPEG